MNDELKFVLTFILGFIILIMVLVVGGYWSASVTCHSQWGKSFKPEYSLFAGCTIVPPSGVRIPSGNYRDMT